MNCEMVPLALLLPRRTTLRSLRRAAYTWASIEERDQDKQHLKQG
jgi:hypothetical protein